MNTEDGYYLRINGEQKGPYSLSHLRHLFSAGFIKPETPFWHEAYEEWQEIGLLAKLFKQRRHRRGWIRPVALTVIFLAVTVPIYICWPILALAIKESWQTEYNAEAAYWSARHYVREQTKPHESLLSFAPFAQQSVKLSGSSAIVNLHVLEAPRPMTEWKVELVYTSSQQEWRAVRVERVGK